MNGKRNRTTWLIVMVLMPGFSAVAFFSLITRSPATLVPVRTGYAALTTRSLTVCVFNGLRVVMLSPDSPAVVPEPSMMVIGSLFGLGGLIARRRLKK